MYVFSIDIPFEGSQSRSNMRSKVIAVQPNLSIFFANSKYIFKKGPVYQGPMGSCFMTKPEVKNLVAGSL
jgi:hypothetical protein